MTDSSIRFVPELFLQRAIAAPEVYPILWSRSSVLI